MQAIPRRLRVLLLLGPGTVLLLLLLGVTSAFVNPGPTTLLRATRQQLLLRRRARSTTPFLAMAASDATEGWDQEADVVVIGSGIGGLSCAALSAYYGLDVRVYESHYHAGGCAHSFEVEGFHFDSGPSLWNGMDGKKGKRNP